MGSTGSRPRLSQVAPCHNQSEGDQGQQASHPTSHWTIPATPTPLEQQHGPQGHRRTTQLPPLKLENPATFPPLSTVGAPSSKGIQRLYLLNRPTQEDIFWERMTGESLDLREILQPSPLPPEQGERQQSQPGPQPQRLCRMRS
ncbi:unnamed protein product [Coregonus sp. 'balchen']|nr:unnamed protein product [Coregonus sp. 'balchen']